MKTESDQPDKLFSTKTLIFILALCMLSTWIAVFVAEDQTSDSTNASSAVSDQPNDSNETPNTAIQ